MKANLIICPTDATILGALNERGEFVIRRWVKNKGNNEITILSATMTLICQCGYGTTLYTVKHIDSNTAIQ